MVLCSIFLQEVGPKMVVRAVAQLYGKRTHFRQKKTEKFWFWNSGFLSARVGFVASSVFDFFMLRFFIFSEAKLFKNRSCFLFVFFFGKWRLHLPLQGEFLAPGARAVAKLGGFGAPLRRRACRLLVAPTIHLPCRRFASPQQRCFAPHSRACANRQKK